MFAATSGSLAPSEISHPFWKMLMASMRDPLPKGTRTTFILSCVTIIKDDYDFQGQGNVTNTNLQPPKCISTLWINLVQGKITKNRGIDIRDNGLFWLAWGLEGNNQ